LKLQRCPKAPPGRTGSAGKAEGFVISRVADEQDGFVPGARRTEQSFRHEPAAKSARTICLGNGKRTKEKRWYLASQDLPHPQRANEITRVLRREREASHRQTALAQALGGLVGTRRAECLIEQAFPCPGIGWRFAGESEVWFANNSGKSWSLHVEIRDRGRPGLHATTLAPSHGAIVATSPAVRGRD
jgi:hypothetical protein